MQESAQQHWLFLLTKSPDTSELASESLDAVVTATLFDQKVDVVFLGDGLDWCDDEKSFKNKDKLELLTTMEDCALYALTEPSLNHSDGDYQSGAIKYSSLSVEQLKNKLNHCDRILSF